MTQGRLHSIETFGSVDGPGTRFVIFLQGCAMRCRYCHNVDTWDPATNHLVNAEELLDQAERYRAYWGEEGGITVSGGEPLLQIDFLLELFQLYLHGFQQLINLYYFQQLQHHHYQL